MAEYEMQEMNLPNKDGKRILYPRLVQHGQASTDYIAKILSEKSSFTRGDIKGLLQELADELAYQMGQGKSVKLDGIGTFVPSLALRIDKERETGEADSTRRNARSIVVGSINFRAEKSLIHNTIITVTWNVRNRNSAVPRRSIHRKNAWNGQSNILPDILI